MIELLIAAPVLLFAGLVILQLVLLMQARQALRLGALEAAREASVSHAEPQAALRGLARGMSPWWIGAQETQDALTGPLQTHAHLLQSIAMGRLRLTQQAPTESAFSDWAVPARDESGVELAGVREIPNDALRIRATETLPNGATSTWREGQPVGAASGLTLLQANVLRLQVDYVLRMRVPMAGQAIALMARNWQTDPALRAMGGRDGVLIRVSVAVRMQSGARHTGGDPGNG